MKRECHHFPILSEFMDLGDNYQWWLTSQKMQQTLGYSVLPNGNTEHCLWLLLAETADPETGEDSRSNHFTGNTGDKGTFWRRQWAKSELCRTPQNKWHTSFKKYKTTTKQPLRTRTTKDGGGTSCWKA